MAEIGNLCDVKACAEYRDKLEVERDNLTDQRNRAWACNNALGASERERDEAMTREISEKDRFRIALEKIFAWESGRSLQIARETLKIRKEDFILKRKELQQKHPEGLLA